MADQMSLGEALTGLIADMARSRQGVFNAPEVGGDTTPLPDVSVESSRYFKAPPLVSGKLYAPVEGGEVGIEGRYRPSSEIPEYGAKVGFRRRF